MPENVCWFRDIFRKWRLGRKSTDITDESWRVMCVAVILNRGPGARRWNGRGTICRWLGIAVMREKSYLSGEGTCILTHTWKAIWLTYRRIVFKKLLRYVQLKSTLGIYCIIMHIHISLWTFLWILCTTWSNFKTLIWTKSRIYYLWWLNPKFVNRFKVCWVANLNFAIL